MRFLYAVAVLSVAAMLSACQTGGDVRLSLGKALAGAELAAIGANQSARAAADTNLCTGQCAANVRPKLRRLNECVGAAYASYVSRDAVTAATLLSQDCFTYASEAKDAIEAGNAP